MGKVIIRHPNYKDLKAFADTLTSRGFKPILHKAWAGTANYIEVEVDDSFQSVEIPLRKAGIFFSVLIEALEEKRTNKDTTLTDVVTTNKHPSPLDRAARAQRLACGLDVVDNTRLFNVVYNTTSLNDKENTQSLETGKMVTGNKILEAKEKKN